VGGLGGHAPGVQLRRPTTLLPYRGVLRVGTRNHAGPLRSGGRTFSSGTSLASPSVRKTFVLRDDRHSKGQRRINWVSALSVLRQLGKWQPQPPDGDCNFTGESWLLSLGKPCVETRRTVYSFHYLASAEGESARPPGADTRRPSPPPPLARVVLFGCPHRRSYPQIHDGGLVYRPVGRQRRHRENQ
jgi:hypothetical protein